MAKETQKHSDFPRVRNAFGMTINEQELLQSTGLPDAEKPQLSPSITQGEWANNWLPPEEEPGPKRAREEDKSSL